jgi:hypothetical protein
VKRRWSDREPYCERTQSRMGKARPLTHVCIKHRFTAKRAGKCPICREDLKSVGLTGRPPKKNQKKKWEKFWADFKDGSHPKGCR